MKKNRQKRVFLTLFYTLFVVLLLLGTRCEPRLHLTTPEKDAKHIAELASTIHTEADLRAVEKLASQYEIAYRNSYNGAKALYFKLLCDDILDQAGERRAAFRAEEDALNMIQTEFDTRLNDLAIAWQMVLGSESEELAKIQQNADAISKLNDELAAVTADKEQLAMDIIDAGYPQDMLDEIGKLEARLIEISNNIKDIEHQSAIIVLANRLQLSRELCLVEECVPSEDIVEYEEPIEVEALDWDE